MAADRDATLTVSAFDVAKPQNFVPNAPLTSVTVPVAAGEERWLDVPLGVELEAPGFVFIVVHAVDLTGVPNLRLRVLATNGSAYAEVVEVRAYGE